MTQNIADTHPADPQAQTTKRRRRAPPSGAAEDCHTCRKRGTECDRRRPYCSQCLEMGKECSGYRTQLTWGVGVASRGKLRGMSLPVLNTESKPLVSDASQKARTASTGSVAPNKRRKSSTLKSEPAERTFVLKTEPMASGEHCFAANPLAENTALQTSPRQQHSPPLPHTASWQMPAPPQPSKHRNSYTFSSPMSMDAPQFPATSPHQLQQGMQLLRTNSVDTAGPLSSSIGSSRSATSMSNYFDQSYNHTSQFSLTPADESPFVDPFLSQYGPSSFSTSPQTSAFPSSFSGRASPNLPGYEHHVMDNNESISSAPSQAVFENRSELSPIHEEGPVLLPFTDTYNYSEFDLEELDINADHHTSPSSIPQSFTDMQFYGLSSRMQYLMKYYDELICPVLVIRDGPMNPYRKHVFPLAMQNVGLQNAIAALVTNNMRMRSLKEVKQLMDGNARRRRDSMESISSSIRRATPEEMHYKAQSIELLNSQLADRTKARDDPILATLLILCLFHVCDSGFSKFKTQLAGVQKLLKMRGPVSSEFVGWVHMFFAWFDVMTSSVNDRETQINTDSFEHMYRAADSSAAEQFSGCDGRLFKIIARLSRLNLLSQSRPVKDMSNVEPRPAPPSARKFEGYVDSSLFDFDLLDGNGWAQPIATDDPSGPDTRHTFWKEWKEIREQLEAVQFHELAPPSSAADKCEQDVVHISESFRHAALLYTERLAYPLVPAASANFAALVAAALHHVRQIGRHSCVTKFLLWPLFVVGSECVAEADRDLVRARCVEIQRESGFYNNLSGLEVLEKVWRQDEAGFYFGGGYGAQALRWRRAMNRVDGEYIIV